MNIFLFLVAMSVATPDSTLTPGAILTTDLAVICQPGYSKAHRVWRGEKQTYAKYTIPWSLRKYYEDDDWIPIEIGGDNSKPENHWTQPLTDAIKKNRLENYEHRAACAHYRQTGDRDATPYQKVFNNWPAEYKRVFGVDP